MPDEERLVDRFVEKINSVSVTRERFFAKDLVPRLWRGTPDQDGALGSVDWQVISSDESKRIEAVEARLPIRLPRSFRYLVTHYAFPTLELPSVTLFANTGEGHFYEFADRLFHDKGLAEVLLPKGYLQFGSPDGGDYDPVCFDTNRRNGHGDCPIVRIDHEAVLQHREIVVTDEIAPSFAALLEKFLAA